MKILWNSIDRLDRSIRFKYTIALTVYGIISCLLGLTLWMSIRSQSLHTWDWMVCFAGYPILFSTFFVFYHGSRYEFHDGSHVS